ncbi:DNA polymerase III subunit gamma/tau [Zymomonas mobilis]|uniref:DNA polymerase III subunit gamma/tau n=1 Tax=Zymomonas mobilis subsp. pomaceae (strain ATCC 29192 / DSM 22645 / JCM 10191 / CCUG 17912 / NBRC 13757 / NCIMB 11200 / NRRL B-4491 / Barker I) TaxID=579138 RepID=F8EV19_ZYMMT|nr:DNA polymerase III subunit gamma/tau [Zymomonas mobilis]AEI37307.1 DNA polymerase III, subunits gamma and tau [Zymomonas mobilis subsp. pomaceae ATCC 29192]MDX5948676.1 DNA polymerase III subunit gamma/tau [Zymomonas mobilis subsp. pomaceae]GEB88481.1 DNA polymerase III subunit gamma/tau [Zymomonas mobilis subsp. pomaceae]
MVDSSSSITPYRVLARKYRPQHFSDLIGQDAMVRTLGNAIARDRLAHAFLLTGVRGVGKTSTARLIAKALNCIGPDGKGGMTIDPCGNCEPCRAIAEGRHIDVIEMDAASHTGVDDIREIVESVRYASVSARFKVYIIDEVHMLSKNAFNALLKTLEEPPVHVKFIFATTEVNKVPITVLSRCQRFDLRRISSSLLAEYFTKIAHQEQVVAEDEALALIAKAAEGSVRDGLSILDQAIAHSAGQVIAADVRDMLGLSDGSVIRSLFSALLQGQGAEVLDHIKAQYDLGIEPEALIQGLLQIVHAVTRSKMGRPEQQSIRSTEEQRWLSDLGQKLSFPVLHRLWQLLLKGHQEVQTATLPLEAAEMALLRVVHASQLPDPVAIINHLKISGQQSAVVSPPSSDERRGMDPIISDQNLGDGSEISKKNTFEDGTEAVASKSTPSLPHEREPTHTVSQDSRANSPSAPIEEWDNNSSDGPVILPPTTSQPIESVASSCASSKENFDQDIDINNSSFPSDFQSLTETLFGSGNALIGHWLEDYGRLITYNPPKLVLEAHPRLTREFHQKLMQALKNLTGEIWEVIFSKEQTGNLSFREQDLAQKKAEKEALLNMPIIKTVFEIFPNAQLVE